MSGISHHCPDALLAAYAVGSLPKPFALVIAAHVSLCLECRASYQAHLSLGGAVLETSAEKGVSGHLKSRIMDALDTPAAPEPSYSRTGVFPGPVVAALKGTAPQWKSIGAGVRQTILSADRYGSARLLYIPPGQTVPDHGHGGLELTLVLQGSFRDATGHFGVGDLEVADQDLLHTPIAGHGPPCICLAATDAPLRFKSLVPRILQPFFRI